MQGYESKVRNEVLPEVHVGPTYIVESTFSYFRT